MALSESCLVFTGAVLPGGNVAVAVGTDVPDNCIEILITNVSTSDAILFGLAAAGGAGVLTERVNSNRIPAGSSLTLSLGALGDRQALTGNFKLVFQDTGAAADVDVTYICRLAAAGVPGQPGRG